MSENWSIRPASHITLLSRVVDLSQGDILEIGTGYFSTLFLHWMAHIYKRNVFSYENDPKWYAKSLKANSKYHKIIFVNNWDELPVDRHWGVVFIDHAPAERRIVEIKKFADKADYIIIHDTEPEHDNDYHFSEIWPMFKHIYHLNKIFPWTSVVSNFKKLDNIA
ncbi:MAG: hypothetical protein UV74_C0011G0006 [Candidatus Woesebacteria bacterium GW2011_GWB1_43_14]|uniref:Uncharacterized protein n=1 Tax=Candidatus Woesebacteria bacterium GW2011_GWB1_43_14 TaxID=1618578 RepID=A0A0G1DJ87_9BACT|nr:MAG: hypothetical protein UV74_C0011G0006 [Candidatus Woesebacteria bacterium GW2011_GWB1_43_14]